MRCVEWMECVRVCMHEERACVHARVRRLQQSGAVGGVWKASCLVACVYIYMHAYTHADTHADTLVCSTTR